MVRRDEWENFLVIFPPEVSSLRSFGSTLKMNIIFYVIFYNDFSSHITALSTEKTEY